MFWRPHIQFLGMKTAVLMTMVIALPYALHAWPSSRESNMFSLQTTRGTTLFACDESNIFSLRQSPREVYFSGESGIFSLRQQESSYNITVSASYSYSQQTVRVTAYVYDGAAGAVVSSGSGSFRVTQGGQTVASGPLAYSVATQWWTATNIPLVGSGEYAVNVAINGQTKTTILQVASPTSVKLVGSAIDDSATPLPGVSIQLYHASDVLRGNPFTPDGLPLPLLTVATTPEGTFDMGDWSPGEYFLRLVTADHFSLSRSFWLRDSETIHSEVVVDDRRLTTVRQGIVDMARCVQLNVLDQQTRWMASVASTVDADIDATGDPASWIKACVSVALGSWAGIAKEAGKKGVELTIQEAAKIIIEKSTEKLIQEGVIRVGTLLAEQKAGTDTRMRMTQGLSLVPYAVSPVSVEYLSEIVSSDFSTLINPGGGEVPTGLFSKLNPVHNHGVPEWPNASIKLELPPDWHSQYSPNLALENRFPATTGWTEWDSTNWFATTLQTYSYAQTQLVQYSAGALSSITELDSAFSTSKAEELFRSARAQLLSISAGGSLIFVSPDVTEVSDSGAAKQPVALNLHDAYLKYWGDRIASTRLGAAAEVSSYVSIGAKAVAVASYAGVISAPIAIVAEGVSKVVGAGELVAKGWQMQYKVDMAVTYIEMAAKYIDNLVSAPEIVDRMARFFESEAVAPYYLSNVLDFDGKIDDVTTDLPTDENGLVLIEVPTDLDTHSFSDFMITREIPATIHIRNPLITVTGVEPAGAHYRVEAKVIEPRRADLAPFSNASLDYQASLQHVLIDGGWLEAGQSNQVSVPIQSRVGANQLATPGTLVVSLWAGPFQVAEFSGTHFRIVPPLTVPFDSRASSNYQAQSVPSADITRPLSYVSSRRGALTSRDVLAMGTRIARSLSFTLGAGSPSTNFSFVVSTDAFDAQCRLYTPLAADLAFQVHSGDEYVGKDPLTGQMHFGFPARVSDNGQRPQAIVIPACAGREMTVHIELLDLPRSPVTMSLEIWEQPLCDAVMGVLPSSIRILTRPGVIRTIPFAIGENSQQTPLEGVTVSMSTLQSPAGNVLSWSNTVTVASTNILAGGLLSCGIGISTVGAADATYTGTVQIASTNAGTVTVPVSITVDGQAPAITIQPIREWWFNPTGPVVSWSGQDNVTAQSNLLYSYILEPLDGSWSGYLQTTNRDLSGITDGNYLISVLARDQALNETVSPSGMVIRIDRAGNLWKQRIVDADPNDGITDISQVSGNDDFDGDGASNLMEFYASTDPTNPGDLFAFDQAATFSTGFVIHWKTKRGVTYQVRRTANLVCGPWEAAPTGTGADEKSLLTAPEDGDQVYRDPTSMSGPVFYKIETQE